VGCSDELRNWVTMHEEAEMGLSNEAGEWKKVNRCATGKAAEDTVTRKGKRV